MPSLPAAGGVAGEGRPERAACFRRGVLGSTGPGLRGPLGSVLVVGLAPAAHGGNRTGRVFTGDRSGDWLYASLYRRGWPINPPAEAATTACSSRRVGDRLRALRPAGQPSRRPTERDRCLPFLERELALLPSLRVVVASASSPTTWLPGCSASPGPALRPRGRGVPPAACWCSARTTRASRTPSPASSPSPCWTPSSSGRQPWSPDMGGFPRGFPARDERFRGRRAMTASTCQRQRRYECPTNTALVDRLGLWRGLTWVATLPRGCSGIAPSDARATIGCGGGRSSRGPEQARRHARVEGRTLE